MGRSESNQTFGSVEPLQEQAVFEQLFEFSPDAILVADQQGRIVRINAQVEKLFGYPRDELISRSVEILMPDRFHEAHIVHRQHYNQEMRMWPMGAGLDLVGKRKDGTEFPVDIMLSPVEAPEGVTVIAVIRDISARKQAEEQLRESEERFRLLVEGVRDYAIFMLDSQGRVKSWNPGAERIKGYTAEEILGQHFSRFYTEEDIERGKPDHALGIAAAQGRFEDEGWRVRKDGSRFFANVIVTALRDENGRLRGFSKVTRDFTERKRAEEALLLEITNVLVSSLDIRQLLSAISMSIRKINPYDYASLVLHDPETNKFRVQLLDPPQDRNAESNECLLPTEDSPAVRAFESREPLVLNRFETGDFGPEPTQSWLSIGIKSGGIKSACWLPLAGHDRVLGTLMLGSRREDAYNAEEVRLLGQAAKQVALALDNAVAFRQITELRDRLAEEKVYLEEELRTEYNFGEIVGQSPILKRALKCWKASSLATKRVRLQAQYLRRLDAWSWRTKELSSWTRSATSRWNCSPSCCAPYRRKSLSASAAPAPFRSTFA